MEAQTLRERKVVFIGVLDVFKARDTTGPREPLAAVPTGMYA
jgi:hypothetical protein